MDVDYYCKHGYFRWGKISRKHWQDISRGGNFHDTSSISFIKAYGFYFRVGVIFAKKTKARKTRKLPPRENFHVYSILNLLKKMRKRDIKCTLDPNFLDYLALTFCDIIGETGWDNILPEVKFGGYSFLPLETDLYPKFAHLGKCCLILWCLTLG